LKIAIDCRSLRKTPSGIPNFVVSAINGLATQNPDWKLYLLSNESFHPELHKALVKSLNIHIIISPLPFLNNVSFIWLLLKVNSLLKEIKPDLYWAPAFLLPPFLTNQVKTLVTVHDLVFKRYKKTMSFINFLYFSLLHDQSINRADLLWANSEYTSKEIENYFPKRKCKSIFTGFFINNQIFKPASLLALEKQWLMEKFNLGEKFILFVGTLEPRKNLGFLLSLMPELADLGFSLIVIGAKGWGETSIKDVVEAPGFPKINVTFAGFVTTEDLVKVYSMASVYVSTSLNEGFGMPQLEAMACGCPVVSPHNSAMIEVVEGAGVTVKTWDKTDWITTINQVYNNREKYIEAGFRRVEAYQIEKVIKNLTQYIARHI